MPTDPGFNYGDQSTPTIDNSTPAPQKDESTTQPPSDETNRQLQNTEDTIHGDLDVTGNHDPLYHELLISLFIVHSKLVRRCCV